MEEKQVTLEQVKLNLAEFNSTGVYHFKIPWVGITVEELHEISGKLRAILPKGTHFLVTWDTWSVELLNKAELETLRDWINKQLEEENGENNTDKSILWK